MSRRKCYSWDCEDNAAGINDNYVEDSFNRYYDKDIYNILVKIQAQIQAQAQLQAQLQAQAQAQAQTQNDTDTVTNTMTLLTINVPVLVSDNEANEVE